MGLRLANLVLRWAYLTLCLAIWPKVANLRFEGANLGLKEANSGLRLAN